MADDPSFPWYASDWLGSNARAMMTLEQQGAYMNLLCRQWADSGCSLPDDDNALAALSGMGEGWLKGGSAVVRDCFEPIADQPGRIGNPRLLSVREERDEWREKSRKGGVKSGQVRKLRQSKGGSTTLGTKQQPNTNSPSPSPSVKDTPLTPQPEVYGPLPDRDELTAEQRQALIRKLTVANVNTTAISAGTTRPPGSNEPGQEASNLERSSDTPLRKPVLHDGQCPECFCDNGHFPGCKTGNAPTHRTLPPNAPDRGQTITGDASEAITDGDGECGCVLKWAPWDDQVQITDSSNCPKHRNPCTGSSEPGPDGSGLKKSPQDFNEVTDGKACGKCQACIDNRPDCCELVPFRDRRLFGSDVAKGIRKQLGIPAVGASRCPDCDGYGDHSPSCPQTETGQQLRREQIQRAEQPNPQEGGDRNEPHRMGTTPKTVRPDVTAGESPAPDATAGGVVPVVLPPASAERRKTAPPPISPSAAAPDAGIPPSPARTGPAAGSFAAWTTDVVAHDGRPAILGTIVKCPHCDEPVPWSTNSQIRVCKNIDCKAKVRLAEIRNQLPPLPGDNGQPKRPPPENGLSVICPTCETGLIHWRDGKQRVGHCTRTDCAARITKRQIADQLPAEWTTRRANPKFIPPTTKEVRAYVAKMKYRFDPEEFIAHHGTRGWKLKGGIPMVDWKLACVTFEKNVDRFGTGKPGAKLARPKCRGPCGRDRDHAPSPWIDGLCGDCYDARSGVGSTVKLKRPPPPEKQQTSEQLDETIAKATQ